MKVRKKIFWQLFPSLLLISIVTLISLLFITQYTFEEFYYNQVGHSLQEKGHVLKNELKPLIEAKQYREVLRRVVLTSAKVNNRITVILPDGKVVADSTIDPELLENHNSRPEIKMALAGKVGRTTRFSTTLEEDYFFLALPIYKGEEIIAVLRNSVPVVTLKESLFGISKQIFAVGSLLIIILAGVNWWLSQKISTPLEIIKNYTTHLNEEHFEEIPTGSAGVSVEIESLTIAFNKMGRRINKQFKKIYNQKEEREAVFNSMVEGVLSINLQGEIFHWNQSLCRLFEIDCNSLFKGKPLIEALENQDIYDLFKQSLENQVVLEEELVLSNRKVIQIHGTPLHSQKGNKMGVLFVFNDITKLRELEAHRKQFVANVSHELRTPLTAIQGFVETLMDGDIDEVNREKFMMIIQKHVNRLGHIIEDLLALANIERDNKQSSIKFEEEELKKVITISVDNCERKAKAKNIKIKTHIPELVSKYRINSHLMEQALTNLIDNAVKYSPENTQINVDLNKFDHEFQIRVKDQGPGISEEHHERLFERFYSVDKARSREMGGSGLGLSIVKHIVKAHGGDITIKSKPSEGSSFIISLPI